MTSLDAWRAIVVPAEARYIEARLNGTEKQRLAALEDLDYAYRKGREAYAEAERRNRGNQSQVSD